MELGMENEHYDNMRNTSDVAISIAVKNNYPIDIVGASPDLCDLSLGNHSIDTNVNFIDIDNDVLNSISKIMLGNPRFKFIHQDITGMNIIVRNAFAEIYKANSDPQDTIKMIIDQCNKFDFKKKHLFEGSVFLSLNVLSELQPPIRHYMEKLHRLYFYNSIENTVNQSLYMEFKRANKLLYRKYVIAHLKLSENYDFSNYIISIYENHRSYIDPLNCTSPSDYQAQMFIENHVDLFQKPMFWDWKISKTRTIRIMQFFIKNGV